jgi:hypothetical protein
MKTLGFDCDKIIGVLLDDGWHPVIVNTFQVSQFEFLESTNNVSPLKEVQPVVAAQAITVNGVSWQEVAGPGKEVYCVPWRAILGLKYMP